MLGHGVRVSSTVGDRVTNVKPGDNVILSFIPHWRLLTVRAMNGTAYCRNRTETADGTSRVHDGNHIAVMSFLGNMAEYAVVPSICVVPIAGARLQDGCFDWLRHHRLGPQSNRAS